MIDVNNENIFIFIINGAYFFLKFAVNILISLFQQPTIKENEIKNIIKEKVDNGLNKKDNSLIYNFIKILKEIKFMKDYSIFIKFSII